MAAAADVSQSFVEELFSKSWDGSKAGSKIGRKDALRAFHHKAYWAQSLREAVANKAVKLADSELLLPDGKTKPTIAYSKAERKKGKLQVRMPSRGEHPSSATGAAHAHALPPPASPSTSLPAPPPLPSQIRAALPPPLAPPERRVTRSFTKQ